MKKVSLSIFLASLAFGAYAQDNVFKGESSRGLITAGTYDEIILDSSVSAKYKAKSVTTGKLTAISGNSAGDVAIANSIDWNEKNGITVDIAKESGEHKVFSVASWEQNLFTLKFTNSVANSSAVALIDFGSTLIQNANANATSKQSDYLVFENINAKVTATEAKIGAHPTLAADYGAYSTFTIAKTANVDWTGNMTFGYSAKVNINGTFTLNGAYADNANAKLYHTGTFIYNNAEKGITFNSKIESSGRFEQTTNADKGVTLQNDVVLNSGASWKVDGQLLLAENHSLTVNEGAKFEFVNNGRLIFRKNATVILNAENCLALANGGFAKFTTYNTAKECNVYVNADQTIGNIYVNQTIMNLYLADDVNLTLTVVDNMAVNGVSAEDKPAELRIFNYQDNSIQVLKTSDVIIAGIETFVKLYDAEGEFLGNATLVDGWITLVGATVPEPAEWAMIFGSIALGFAIYRRRK